MILEDMGSTNGTFCNGDASRARRSPTGTRSCGSTTILKFSYHDKLDEAFQRQMSESALRDGLTQRYNKHYFLDRVESEFAYAMRHNAPLSLIFLDIDHFKAINDVHGHPAGDEVLAQLATLVTTMLRGGRPRALRRRGVRGHRARLDLARRSRCRERVRARSRRNRSPSRARRYPGDDQRRHVVAPGLGSRRRSIWWRAPTRPCTTPSARAATASASRAVGTRGSRDARAGASLPRAHAEVTRAGRAARA